MSNEETGVTSGQVRAARALLRLSQEDLAKLSGVSLPTIIRMERKDGPLAGRPANVEAVRRALEKRVEFIEENGGGPGVRLRKRGRR